MRKILSMIVIMVLFTSFTQVYAKQNVNYINLKRYSFDFFDNFTTNNIGNIWTVTNVGTSGSVKIQNGKLIMTSEKKVGQQ